MAFEKLKEIYEKKYKLLMIIPFVILILSIGILGYTKMTTGEYIGKDVTLKGGLLITVDTSESLNIESVANQLSNELGVSVNVKALSSVGAGSVIGYTFEIESGISIENAKAAISKVTGFELVDGSYTIEEMSPALSASFWRSTIKAILIAFAAMGIVVFIYFRKLAPSAAVILAAASDLIGTLAIMNLLGMKLSVAGVAAILMLIGYSVDTDILLSTRVLKRHELGTVMERIYSSLKTGLTMQGTTLTALFIIFIISPAAVLKEIVGVLMIGLVLDLPNTWLQNVGILLIIIFASIWTISPKFNTNGVLIGGVESNSTAEVNGLQAGMIITAINGETIEDLSDYQNIVSNLQEGDIISVNTNEGDFSLLVDQKDNAVFLGINPKEVPSTNLKKGLDLVGGARVLLKPNQDISSEQMDDITMLIEKRLNVYGVSDVTIRPISDLEGNKYIIIEMAGASKEEVADLVSKQGKFEAKIGDEVVFVGGKDIVYVDKQRSGVDLSQCGQIQDGDWTCRFQFSVDITPESAKKHAELTSRLEVIIDQGDRFLSENLDLYLDDELVDSLLISEDLKGVETTTFTIQGPGRGTTKDAAINNAILNMKEMQTLLISGSLPVKLDIAKIDIISPTLGEKFFSSAIVALFVAMGAVGVVIFAKYRKLKITAAIMTTVSAEVIIILGFAALIKWNLDLAAIAGILAAVGTGVDAQIVITDEVMKGAAAMVSNWKGRIKKAFFIIMGAYFTTVVAMIPLYAAGAGLLKGFALTTIAGISIGVFITRPAYAKMIEILMD